MTKGYETARQLRDKRAWEESDESRLAKVVRLATVGVSTEVVHAMERRMGVREEREASEGEMEGFSNNAFKNDNIAFLRV